MKQRKRYTEEQKKLKLHLYHGKRRNGSTALEASRAVGVHYISLLQWEKDAREEQGVASKAVNGNGNDGALRLEAANGMTVFGVPDNVLRLVTPSGMFVYGSPSDLADLMKHLGGLT